MLTTVPRSPSVYFISFVAALGGLLFGFDTAVISGTIPFITQYFALSENMLGWAVGCILIGCAIGALLAGKLADAWGRKKVLLLCAVLFAASGIGAGLANDLMVFILFRLIGGLGVGAAAMVSPMYIAETAPAASRGKMVSLYQLAIVLGILLAYLSNYLLINTGDNNWRWMFAAQAAPSLLFFAALFFVPESPRWFLLRSERETRICPQETGRRGVFNVQYLPVLIIGISIAVFQQITGINAILYYAPTIFEQTGLSHSSALGQTIFIGIINVLSTFIAILFVDRIGRKTFLLYGSAIMSVCLLMVALCFHYNYFSHYLVLIFTLLYVATFGCTLGAVTWVYLSEIFPNAIRAAALSVATLTLWLADFVITYTFPVMTQHLGTACTLLVYAGCCLLCFVFVYSRVKETRGRTLEDIESLFIK